MATEFKERKRWVFFGLPFTFTTYTISEELITIDSGFFTRVEDDCYMYKIKDVKNISNFLLKFVCYPLHLLYMMILDYYVI